MSFTPAPTCGECGAPMGNTIGRPTRESFGGRVIRPAVQRLVCIVDDRHQVTERRTA